MSVAAPQASSKRPPMKQFQLMDGFHVGPDPDNPALDRVYERGQIIESPTDLTFMNVPGFKPKYEPVVNGNTGIPAGASVFDPSKETIEAFAERMRASLSIGIGSSVAPPSSPAPTTTELDAMNADQLRKYAEAEEIDVKAAKTKEQLLAVIKGSKR